MSRTASFVAFYYSMELGRLPRVKTVANLMRKICYENKDHLMAGMIVGGWDPYEGGQIYEIPLGGTLLQQKFAVGGSGSTYIFGLLDATYKENMSKTECQNFVKKCKFMTSCYDAALMYEFSSCITKGISHAMARDGSSGGVIRLVTIEPTGVERECILGECDDTK